MRLRHTAHGRNVDMSRMLIAALVLTIAAGTSLLAQVARSPEVQFKAAQYKEQVEGDLQGAVTEYGKVVGGKDRALAAEASARIAAINLRLTTSAVSFGRVKAAAKQTSTPTAPAPQGAPVVVA